jgi:hypothetical protein
MADWSRLAAHLNATGAGITLTWSELEDLVGDLPASATNHRAWWSGDRAHVRSWETAGFRMSAVDLGRHITFTRNDVDLAWDRASLDETRAVAREDGSPTIVLITCVKTKLVRPAPAKDLYTSTLFRRAKGYAESSGLPWYILSAEHGLLQPDEWLAPYERYLPDTPQSYRRAWGSWVVERLALLAGPLDGQTIEVHASAAYVDAIRDGLETLGARIVEPLRGLEQGRRLAWYATTTPVQPDPGQPASLFIALLSDSASTMSPNELRASDRAALAHPGLYSWWADSRAAADLTAGLGHSIEPGLIYAGLAGATRWPSGKQSTNTLWSRIVGMHLGKRHEFSTFRRTLGSVLAAKHGADHIDEAALTAWMDAHLRVIAVPHDDPDTLGRLESEVLVSLDPPLNLQGMGPSPVRQRLTELRRRHTRPGATS